MFDKTFFRLWRLYRLFKDPYQLDIHVADHCNLNCVGCTHYSPVAKPSFCDPSAMQSSLRTLRERKVLGRIKFLNLVGGEPLLHPDIAEVLRIVGTECGTTGHPDVKLITNGLLLGRMGDDFWDACRRFDIIVSITHYPVSADYGAMLDLCREKGVRHEYFADRTGEFGFALFRLRPKMEAADGRVKALGNYLSCISRCMQLSDRRIYPCAQCAYSERLNEAFGTDFRKHRGDWLDIDGISRFKLARFWFSAHPFCRHCIFPPQPIRWKQSERTPDEWIAR